MKMKKKKKKKKWEESERVGRVKVWGATLLPT
jgi:hypothetical protein